MDEPLRNYAEAAAWLGVPVKWLQGRVQRGEAPHTRLGKHVRFTRAHLDAIVRAGERRPTGKDGRPQLLSRPGRSATAPPEGDAGSRRSR